jgi:crossover junction endodeoxyribonuclease RusA
VSRAIYLPYPPTTNNLFMNVGKRRIRTGRYDLWIAEATVEVLRQRPEKVTGPYCLTLVATRPDRRARDLGNLEKPVSDLLVKCGVVRDDSDAQEIRLAWADCEPDKTAGVRVLVEAA